MARAIYLIILIAAIVLDVALVAVLVIFWRLSASCQSTASQFCPQLTCANGVAPTLQSGTPYGTTPA